MKYIFKKKRNIFLATFFDFLGPLLFWFLKPSKKFTHEHPKTILVLRMDHLGDVLPATGIPRLLKQRFPGAKIIFLTSGWAAPLLQHNPDIDEVMIYDAPWFAKGRYKKAISQKSFLGVARFIKSKKVDLALSLRGDLRENLLLALAGVKKRIGYGITGGAFLLSEAVSYRPDVHESQHTLDLLKAIGIEKGDIVPMLYFDKKEEAALDARLTEWGISGQSNLLGFHLGAGSRAKEWPKEHIESFVNLFTSRFEQTKLVFVGNDLGFDKTKLKKRGVIDLTGKPSLRELCVLMRRFSLFVGADSGPAHIAAALGVPTIFLYSGTNDFEQWKPLAKNAHILRKKVFCSPCGLTICPVEGHPCMSEILPHDVLSAIEERKLFL